jgi:hypothetical protein
MYKTPNSRSETEFPIYIVRIQIGVVGIATRLRPGRFGVLFPARETDSSLLRNVVIGSEEHPASYSMGCGVLSPRVKGH